MWQATFDTSKNFHCIFYCGQIKFIRSRIDTVGRRQGPPTLPPLPKKLVLPWQWLLKPSPEGKVSAACRLTDEVKQRKTTFLPQSCHINGASEDVKSERRPRCSILKRCLFCLPLRREVDFAQQKTEGENFSKITLTECVILFFYNFTIFNCIIKQYPYKLIS